MKKSPREACALMGWGRRSASSLVGPSLVWGASGIARELGVSELIIGLTIVALGTSFHLNLRLRLRGP